MDLSLPCVLEDLDEFVLEVAHHDCGMLIILILFRSNFE